MLPLVGPKSHVMLPPVTTMATVTTARVTRCAEEVDIRRTFRRVPPRRPYPVVNSLPSLSTTLSLEALTSTTPGIATGIAANTIVYVLGSSILLKGLALNGVISSYVLGCVSYAAFGPYGYVLVCLYFLIGSYVTKLRMDVKTREGTAEANRGRRGLRSVLGSAVAGMACAVAALLVHTHTYSWLSRLSWLSSLSSFATLQVGFAASFCSKLSDTVSSEIGKAYGRTTYLATTFEKVPRGTEGAVSLEGTVAGIVGSVVLGLCGVGVGLIDGRGLGCVVVASAVANWLESVVGAGLQGRLRWLTNDVVNMLQISVASVLAMWGYSM